MICFRGLAVLHLATRQIQEKVKENRNVEAGSRLQITEVRNEEMVQKLEDLTKGMFK